MVFRLEFEKRRVIRHGLREAVRLLQGLGPPKPRHRITRIRDERSLVARQGFGDPTRQTECEPVVIPTHRKVGLQRDDPDVTGNGLRESVLHF